MEGHFYKINSIYSSRFSKSRKTKTEEYQNKGDQKDMTTKLNMTNSAEPGAGTNFSCALKLELANVFCNRPDNKSVRLFGAH